MPEPVKNGFKLSDSVRAIAKAHGLNCDRALERFISESVLWALTKVADLPMVVKGGLLHPQTKRETGDADILLTEQRTAVELYGHLGAAARVLAQHGILWSPGEVRLTSMGGRGSGYKIPVRVKLGATRVITDLDVSFGAIPEGSVRREFRSMFKGPSFTAWAQPLEAQVADKLAACATLGMGNSRLKDYRDLLRMREADLDVSAIARHLYATMRERRADMAVLLGVPDGLSFEYVDKHTWTWRALAAADGGLPLDFMDVVCTIRHWYGDVMDRWHDLALRDALEPRRRVEAPPLETDERGVYDLDSYRRMRL